MIPLLPDTGSKERITQAAKDEAMAKYQADHTDWEQLIANNNRDTAAKAASASAAAASQSTAAAAAAAAVAGSAAAAAAMVHLASQLTVQPFSSSGLVISSGAASVSSAPPTASEVTSTVASGALSSNVITTASVAIVIGSSAAATSARASETTDMGVEVAVPAIVSASPPTTLADPQAAVDPVAPSGNGAPLVLSTLLVPARLRNPSEIMRTKASDAAAVEAERIKTADAKGGEGSDNMSGMCIAIHQLPKITTISLQLQVTNPGLNFARVLTPHTWCQLFPTCFTVVAYDTAPEANATQERI